MSSNVFPTLGQTATRLARASTARTSTFRTVSGRRQSVSWGAPTVAYAVRFPLLDEAVAAPNESGSGGQNWSAYSQPAVVQKFWDDHTDFDSFLYNIRDVGGVVQKRVKFVDGTFSLSQGDMGRWSCEFTIEVVP